MVQLSPVESFVMSLAIEDWYGLYELLFEDESLPHELSASPNRRTVLMPAVKRLLELGLIQVGVRAWPSGVPSMAPAGAATALLEADSSWIPAESEVIFTATPLGDRLFQRPTSA